MLTPAERDARRDIPAGYSVVRFGPIRPDDLLFVWPGGGFDRADSPAWTFPVPADARNATLCVRKATFDAAAEGFRHTRTYTLNRGPAIATPKPALPTDPQGSLF